MNTWAPWNLYQWSLRSRKENYSSCARPNFPSQHPHPPHHVALHPTAGSGCRMVLGIHFTAGLKSLLSGSSLHHELLSSRLRWLWMEWASLTWPGSHHQLFSSQLSVFVRLGFPSPDQDFTFASALPTSSSTGHQPWSWPGWWIGEWPGFRLRWESSTDPTASSICVTLSKSLTSVSFWSLIHVMRKII